MDLPGVKILQGDCVTRMADLADGSVQTCVTSPPYFGLRDYGVDGQIGLEETPEAYIARLVEVFREVRRVLADDGTLWLNIGDSYAANRGYQVPSTLMNGDATNKAQAGAGQGMRAADFGLKPKDLIGIPWMLAFALRADGWYLRQDIIWHKPNPMPESVRDRCTKAHEYIFLLSKSERYFYDRDGAAEQAVSSEKDLARARIIGRGEQAGSAAYLGSPQRDKSGGFPALSRRNSFARTTKASAGDHGQKPQFRPDREPIAYEGMRNRRSVWTVATKPYKGAHFATFPPALIEPCILAGSRPGDLVLDPFNGSGTTGQVALQHGRRYVGCELNPDYVKLTFERLKAVNDNQRQLELA